MYLVNVCCPYILLLGVSLWTVRAIDVTVFTALTFSGTIEIQVCLVSETVLSLSFIV